MAENIPIFDGHNDTLLNLLEQHRGQGRSFFEESTIGHIDLPRARKGGLIGGFFAMFTPPPNVGAKPAVGSDPALLEAYLEKARHPVDLHHALSKTMAMARIMYEIEAAADGHVAVVRTLDALHSALDNGALAMIFHIEGAEAIDEGLDALYVLYEAGLRSLGLVWSRPNVFANGVPFTFPGSPDQGEGLTVAGVDLVRACNALGIMIDMSHLNEKGFWDVARYSTHPLVATHSCVHALSPSPRNLTDKQLDAIAESGGIVGVNYHVGFLRADGQQNADTPLDDLVRHIDYMVKRMGIDHVALGSDFDGATVPNELGDVTGLPRLMALLGERGYAAAALRKIGSENWIRILEATWPA
ncbi:MAG: dipeptidase [Bacteroidota bacterium]